MVNNVNKMYTYRLMLIGLILFLLARLYIDYQNVQVIKLFMEKPINEYIVFDKSGKYSKLIYRKSYIHFYDNSFSYCGNRQVQNHLENRVTPSNLRTKLFITKDRNSNLLKTMVNDTCYQFRVYADQSMFGKFFK